LIGLVDADEAVDLSTNSILLQCSAASVLPMVISSELPLRIEAALTYLPNACLFFWQQRVASNNGLDIRLTRREILVVILESEGIHSGVGLTLWLTGKIVRPRVLFGHYSAYMPIHVKRASGIAMQFTDLDIWLTRRSTARSFEARGLGLASWLTCQGTRRTVSCCRVDVCFAPSR